MGEYHRLHETDARSEAGREQRRDTGKNVCSEEDSSQRRGLDPETEIKPVGRKALHYEAAAKCVEREEARYFKHDCARRANAQPAFDPGRTPCVDADFSGR